MTAAKKKKKDEALAEHVGVAMTIEHVRAHHVRLESSGVYVEAKHAKDEWPRDEWRVTLSYAGREFSTAYETGIGHRAAALSHTGKGFYRSHASVQIDVRDVLSTLFLDASSGEQTHVDWCADAGVDPDSRAGLDMYLQCQRIAADLRRLLGTDYAAIVESLADR